MASVDSMFGLSEKVLGLRGYRQQLLASNIANADTPNYKAMDVDFAKALKMAGAGGDLALRKTAPGHLSAGAGGALDGVRPQYRGALQPSIDGNTVDLNVEQAKFTENALQYTTTLQFLNDKIKGVKLALQGN